MSCGKSEQVILCNYFTYGDLNFGLNQALYKGEKNYSSLFHLLSSKTVGHFVVFAVGVGDTDFSFLYLLENTLY